MLKCFIDFCWNDCKSRATTWVSGCSFVKHADVDVTPNWSHNMQPIIVAVVLALYIWKWEVMIFAPTPQINVEFPAECKLLTDENKNIISI